MLRRILKSALGAGILIATFTPARADFHFMVIQEVYAGHPGRPGAHYVVLRMTAFGQNIVHGQKIFTFLPDGTPGPDFGTFLNDVPNGASGSRILMATPDAVQMFGIAADQVTGGRLPSPSGRICFGIFFGQFVDCVAYGNFTGNNTGFGSPAVAIEPGKALKRTQDTNNNAADFVLGAPTPANNAGAVGGTDRDGDLVPDFSDCAPSDPSLWFVPAEVTGVGVQISAHDGTSAVVQWNSLAASAGTSTLYDLAAGSLPALNSARGYTGVASCAARDVIGTVFTDSAAVLPADGRFWLVRGRNGCGVGTYGNSSVSPDPRDALDDPSTDPCAAATP